MGYLPTLEHLIQDLQLAKDMAIKHENINGLINSIMSQAKLLGIDKSTTLADDKPTTIELIAPLSPETAKAIDKQLEEDY